MLTVSDLDLVVSLNNSKFCMCSTAAGVPTPPPDVDVWPSPARCAPASATCFPSSVRHQSQNMNNVQVLGVSIEFCSVLVPVLRVALPARPSAAASDSCRPEQSRAGLASATPVSCAAGFQLGGQQRREPVRHGRLLRYREPQRQERAAARPVHRGVPRVSAPRPLAGTEHQ